MDKLTGELFSAMVENGYRDLKAHYEEINALNVFPVPDGDTGTNIGATLNGGVTAMKEADQNNLGDLAEKLAAGMLLGARGNSGVIVSQFFAGISDALSGLSEANVTQFAGALRSGTEKAYVAVVNPVEGTILTVAREGTKAVFDHLPSLKTFEELFDVLLKEMRVSLEKTPDLLPVLKEAGVIDSGAAGLVYIIEGMAKELTGEKISDSIFNAPAASLDVTQKVPFDENSDLEYGYCTEFIMQLLNAKAPVSEFKLQSLIDYLGTIGDSIVAIQQKSIVKIHVHTKEPWKAIKYAQQYGEFVTFKMENMSIQFHEKLLKEMKAEAKTAEVEHIVDAKPCEIGIVAVSPAPQITELFLKMGVSEVISGGQTMNPSAEDFIRAFDASNAKHIIVFPNNGNVILTAEQAAKLYEKAEVRVLHAKSIVQAYSALSMADPVSMTFDENIEAMEEAIGNVQCGEISPAIRDSSYNGVPIKKGDYMGILNNEIVSSSEDIYEAVKGLLSQVDEIDEKEVLTVFYGKDASEEMRKRFVGTIGEVYPMMEVIEIDGGQSVYPFVLAVE